MIFKRPSGITLTQMAQWIDSVDILTCNQETLIEYLFHLVYFKAQQSAFFTDTDMYDDFSLYCVSKLINRLSNIEEQKVKSVLNYIKTVLVPWKCDYIREFCVGSADNNMENFNLVDFSDYLIDESSTSDVFSYPFDTFSLGGVVKAHLKRIPRRKRDPEWSNIYVSCLLTLNDRIKSSMYLAHKHTIDTEKVLFSRVIRELKTKPPILFHLDDSMSTYISVLVNEITHAITAELSYVVHNKVSVTDCLMNLVTAANNQEE